MRRGIRLRARHPADQQADERLRFWSTTWPQDQRGPGLMERYRAVRYEAPMTRADVRMEDVRVVRSCGQRVE